MAINNYTDLKNQVIRFLSREDFNLDFDTFVSMTESEMFNNTTEILDITLLEKSVTLTTNNSKEILLPSDFISVKDLRIANNGKFSTITFKTPDQLVSRSSTGSPMYYTIFNNKIRLDVLPDEMKTFELDYNAELTPLSAINTTNEVLQSNPNIYFYGCMWSAKMLSQETQDAIMYYQQFMNAIKGTNFKALKQKHANGLAMSFENFPDGI